MHKKNRVMNFIEYFKGLAERHVDVRHGAKGEVHFLSSDDEMHTAVDSVLCYPAMIIDRGSGYRFSGEPGAYFKNREYVVIIVEHVSDTSDYQQIEQALQHCESIFDSCMNQLNEDKRKRIIRIDFALEEVSVDYVRNNDNQLYGVAAAVVIAEPYKPLNCDKSFLLDRSFDETFDNSFN